MINPESVSTPIVSEAVGAYADFWPPYQDCRCGKVRVCAPCEWAWQIERLQARINASGLSIPVPTIKLRAGDKPEFPSGNPLAFEKPHFKTRSYKKDVGAHARRAAQTLLQASLPVFYASKTQLINLAWNKQYQVASDLMLFAPVLVVYDNSDENRSAESIFNLLHSRAYGIAYLIEPPRAPSLLPNRK